MITTTFNRDAMIKTFELFLANNHTKINTWLEGDGWNIYVRIAKRALCVNPLPTFKSTTLDLASISFDPKHQKQRHFTHLLNWLEEHCPYPIYVENVMSKQFADFFDRRNYFMQPRQHSDAPFCFVSPKVLDIIDKGVSS